MHREEYRATLILMAGMGLASLSGFLREAALAHQLGTGAGADVYLIAFTVPEFALVALPIVLSSAFLPFYAALRLRSQARAWGLAWSVAGALLAVLVGATILLAGGAPWVVRWLAPGFDLAELEQATRALCVMLPAISLMGLASLAGAVLQVHRRFARPALATAIYNVTFVGALLLLPLAWPVGRAAWGVTLGAAAALLVQVSLVVRTPAGAAADAEGPGEPAGSGGGVRDVARVAVPLAVGYAAHHVIYFVDRAMATTVGVGGVATLNYAYRLALVVGQFSGLAVATALFPRMSEQAAEDDLPALRSTLAGALGFVWTVGLPASLGLVVLRGPLVQLLFERGAFDRAATAAVVGPLAWYALAVLADALCQPLWRVLYARRRPWLVLAVNSLQTGVRILANLALIQRFGYNGLAFSAALGLGLQVAVLGLLVRRTLGAYLPRQWWERWAGVLVAGVCAAALAALVAGRLPPQPAARVLLAGGGAGCLAYLAILWFVQRRRS